MKEAAINCRQTAVEYGRSLVVAQPGSRALDDPALLVALQGATILHRWFAPTLPVPGDYRFASATPQLFAHPVSIVAATRDQGSGFCRGHPDRTSSPFDGPDCSFGSLRTATVHLVPLPRLRRPFYIWSETAVVNDSLRFSCWRLLNSRAPYFQPDLLLLQVGVGPRRWRAKETPHA